MPMSVLSLTRCRFMHEIPIYLANKPRDIWFDPSATLSDAPPFVQPPEAVVDPSYPSLDLSTTCAIFAERGHCKHGFKCRFLGSHAQKNDVGQLTLQEDEDRKARSAVSASEVNFTTPEVLRLLRARKVKRHIYSIYQC